MTSGRLRIGYPDQGAYSLALEQGLYSLAGQSAELTYSAIQGTDMKFTDGHYMMFDVGSGGGTAAEKQDLMQDFASETNLVGFFLKERWKNLEGNTQGDYSAGDVLIDSYLDALPVGKVFVLGVRDQLFGGSVPSNGHGLLPTYLDAIDGGPALWPGGDPWSGTLIIQAKLYEQATMNRYIALFQHYIERYADDDRFEMMITGETAMGVVGQGYSSTKLLTQYLRFVQAGRGFSARQPVGVSTNYLGSLTTIQPLMEACGAYLIDTGGPDSVPRSERQFDDAEVYLGNDGSDPGDLRGIVPRSHQVDGTELGGYIGNFTPAQIENDAVYGRANMRYTRIMWYHNTPGRMPESTAATQWGNGTGQGILWWIRNNPLVADYPYGTLVGEEPEEPTPGPIEYVSNGSVVEANATSVTPGYGATAVAGDLLLTYATVRTATAGRTLTCAGTTTLRSFGASSQQPMYLFAKIATGGETLSPAVVPVGAAAGEVVQAVSMILRNTLGDLSTVLHAGANKTTTTAGTGLPIQTAAIEVTQPNCILLNLVSFQRASSAMGNFDPNGTGAWDRPVYQSTTTGNDQSIAVYKAQQTAASSILAGTLTVTQSTAVIARTMVVALRAA
jgi:hypothetical protein